MSAVPYSSGDGLPPLPPPGATPREVRAALRPEYHAEFDRDYQDALAEAGRSLDLTGVHDTVEHWRRRSWIVRDQQRHRELVRRAATLLEGREPPADEPVSVTEARI
jgi:hypothetical protein